MRSSWKKIFWAAGTVVLGIVVFVLYLQGRGGHYPNHPAASFPKRLPPAPSAAAPGEPLAQTDAGTLRGAYVGSTIAFRGIPYARPPVGELRWQPPLSPVPWQGVKQAAQPGSACTQRAEGLIPFIAPMAEAYGATFSQPPLQSSEDCLYLDVWVPQWPAKQALPVMVWLHGGSNTVGSGTQSTYGGVSLTQHGVVLVTLNYRLGVMGFFSHPELSAESPHHSSGNYGLLDQLAALSWVKRNIAQFGGDPDNVTLFGESAGAIDAARLMTSPLSAGLFRRVISESGPAFEPARTLSEAEAFGSAMSALAPADSQTTALQRLRALPAAEVEKLVVKAKEHFPADITSATSDGWVLTQSPQRAFLDGSIQKVDLLIGINGREFSAFRLSAAAAAKSSGNKNSVAESGGFNRFSAAARPYFGSWTNPAIALYFGQDPRESNRRARSGCQRSDRAPAQSAPWRISPTIPASAFLCTASTGRFPAKARLNWGHSTAWKSRMCSEALGESEWQWLPSTADDAALSNLLQTYWTNFAKSGDPNAPGLPDWPAWSSGKMEFLVVNKDASVSAQRNFAPLFSRLAANELREGFKAR